jgi:hypothetical protein
MTKNYAKNPIIGVIAVVAIVVTWVVILKPGASSAGGDVYFLDMNTRELYAETKQTLSPSTAPSGAPGVRAHVFACGECTADSRFVAFVERYTDEALAAKKDGSAVMNPQLLTEGQQVSDDKAENWVPRMSPAGQQLMRSATHRCDKPIVCTP